MATFKKGDLVKKIFDFFPSTGNTYVVLGFYCQVRGKDCYVETEESDELNPCYKLFALCERRIIRWPIFEQELEKL